MRWYIIRVLLHKEWLRQLANRGGLVLAGLLVVMAMLLSFFGRSNNPAGALVGGVQLCYVDFWQDDPWMQYLQRHIPPDLQNRIRFRFPPPTNSAGDVLYPQNTGGIQIRQGPTGPDGTPEVLVMFWHPGEDSSSLAPFEEWFWKESRAYFRRKAAAALERMQPGAGNELKEATAIDDKPDWFQREAHRHFRSQVAEALSRVPIEARQPVGIPELATDRATILGAPDPRSTIAAALVLFSLFFFCVYLLPSLTCEERERGVLLAQALSPASPVEILAAKFLFYPALAMALAATLAGIYDIHTLARPFFWLALTVAAFGSLGIGLTIASLARTQRAASMGALCYMLVVTTFLFIFQQSQIPWLSTVFLEYHAPRMLQAALANSVTIYHMGNLAGAAALSVGWSILAVVLFRRLGWQ